MNDNWPKVVENDDGIRPAGNKDECFYCRRKIGQPHEEDCVIVTKKVKVRYSFEIEIDVPHFWDKDNIEFKLNDSSWCADNALEDLTEYAGDGCLCGVFDGEFIEVVDSTPQRKTVKPSAPPPLSQETSE
jgi:hypothetical protein